MISSSPPLKGSPGRTAGLLSRSEAYLCLAFAAVMAMATSLALISLPKRVREAREYDQARALGIQTEDRWGWHAEPAVVLGERITRGRSRTWKIELALRPGETQTVLMGRGNLRRFAAPGSHALVQFWHGKITRIQCGDRAGETWDNPDWLLFNTRVGAMMCSLILLIIPAALLFRLGFRVVFRIRVSDR